VELEKYMAYRFLLHIRDCSRVHMVYKNVIHVIVQV